MSKRTLRNAADCPIFGPPCLFNKFVLPTVADTLKHIIFVRNEEKEKNNGKHPPISNVFNTVAKDIIEVWTTASLPTVTIQRVKQMLKSNYDKYLHFLRYPKSKQTENFTVKLQEWQQKCVKELFDICCCKCIEFNICTCPRENKVPVIIIMEPGSLYLGHLTLLSGTGKAIAEAIHKYFTNNEIHFNKLLVIGWDGTATNTSWKSGVIRNMELKLGRPLQWFICQLHANELPLRHLF